MSIIKHDELDFKKVNYSKPEKQGVIYYASMNYDNKPFYLQTPKMSCKNSFKDVLESNNSLLDVEPVNMDYSFYYRLLSLDEKNVKCTFENNKAWFDKNIPLEIIDNMYKRNNKPVKKTRRKKKKPVKRDWKTLRFMCINEEDKFEIIEFPSVLGKNYIETFGLLTVRTKQEIKNWLTHNNVF